MDNVENNAGAPQPRQKRQSKENLLAELNRVTQLSALLSNLTKASNKSPEIGNVLLDVIGHLVRFGKFDLGEIFALDSETEDMVGLWSTNCNGLTTGIQHIRFQAEEIARESVGLIYVKINSRAPSPSLAALLKDDSSHNFPSATGVMLVVQFDGDILGCIRLNNSRYLNPVSKQVVQDLLPIGEHVALIWSHTLLRSKQNLPNRSAKFLDAFPEIHEGNDPDVIYRAIRDTILETSLFDRAGVFAVKGTVAHGTWGTDEDGNLRDEHSQQFPIDRNEKYAHHQRFLVEKMSTVLATGEVVVDVPKAVVTLWDGEELIGIVAVDNLISRREITPAMLTTLLAITDQAGMALRNSRLATRQEAIVREQRRLMEIAVAITANVDTDDILRMVRDAIYETGIVDRVGVFLVQGSFALGTWGTGPNGQVRDEHSYHFEMSDLVAKHESCLKGTDPYAIDENRPALIATGQTEYMVPYAVVPMRAGEEMIGLVTVDNLLTLRKLTPERLDRILPVVRQAAVVIQNSRLMTAAKLELEKRRLAETQLRSQAEELTKARDEALSASRVKSEFLANMSHEIRTPMNGILGLISILLRSRLTTDQHSYALSVQRSAESLMSIIDDILDLSNLEAKQLRIQNHPFNLRDCIEDVAEIMAAEIQGDQRSLNCYVPVRFPEWVVGDSDRIRQMVTNLASNALKFTPKGEINIEVACMEESETHAQIRISVTDSGVGIAEAFQQSIFNSFTQADGSITRQHGGTGLGLTITKQLVELMGGSISLRSQPGQGSTFWLDLPLQKQIPPASFQEIPQDLRNARLLIISRNMTIQGILTSYLSSWGCHPMAFDTIEDACRVIALQEPPVSIDFILLDRQEDVGLFATQISALRAYSSTEKSLAVLLTSRPIDGLGGITTDSEFAAVMPKTIRLSQLRNTLKRLVLGQRADSDADIVVPELESDSINLGLRILLAEDNMVNAFVASKRLEDWNCEVVVTENGKEALQALDEDRYDLVLMDISMPVMDGLKATEILREREQVTGKHIPVIAITAYALAGDRERCLQVGMDDYVAKPIDFNELLGKLRYWAFHS